MTQPFTVKAPPLELPEPGDASVAADPLAVAAPPLNPALTPADEPPAARLGRRLLWILGGLVAAAVLVDLASIGYGAMLLEGALACRTGSPRPGRLSRIGCSIPTGMPASRIAPKTSSL